MITAITHYSLHITQYAILIKLASWRVNELAG